MILAIDPGRDKCGLALLDDDQKIHRQEIIPTAGLGLYLTRLMGQYSISRFILGNGTYSAKIEEQLKEIAELPVYLVEESGTTFLAEERYRKEHLARGWRCLFAFIKWRPDRPVDDYVAVILAERFLKDHS